MNQNNYCVIMAGGIGSRFWPLSRVELPKQFVDALGVGKTFIQLTYERFSRLIPTENFLVMTGEGYKDLVLEQLPMLRPEQVLTEPCRRNTAPCIAYAMCKLFQRDPEAVAVVTPSDQYIGNEQAFEVIMVESLTFARRHPALLTVGITPTYPATGYGYIQTQSQEGACFTPVQRFKEKPDLRTAMSYLNEGNYYWNSGMFVWSAQAIVEALRTYLPEVTSLFEGVGDVYDTPQEQDAVNAAFMASPSISIDYGVMERSDKVYVCCTNDLAWSDVGSWGALYGLLTKDEQLNAASGTEQIRLMASDGNLVKETNPNKKVVIDGLSGFLVADTEDVLMICPLGDENHLKQVIETFSK
ncbi:MAG: mannose-1-phosphate guanylyltransferase [Parabacteroides sp.]